MPLQKIQLRPGINRDLTAYTNKGGWQDGNLVRFRLGFPQSIGGWQRASSNSFLGTCRSLMTWNTLSGNFYTAMGTSSKYYISYSGTYYDITPIRKTVTLSNPFTATNGSPIITVAATSHGASLNDYVIFSGAVTLGGAITATVLNREYRITKIVNDNSFQITAAVNATSGDTGHGGTTVTTKFLINTGLDTQTTGSGWGSGTWSRSTWASAQNLDVSSTLSLWTQDTYGEDLLLNIRRGDIYYWKSSSGVTNNRAMSISSLSTDPTTPTKGLQVILSDRDRHVIVFGANNGGSTVLDPLLIRFSESEDYTLWSPTPTNTAGDLRIDTGSLIVRAIETKREILVFTDIALYSMQYIGPPYTFGIQQISSNLTTMSYNGFGTVEDTIYWMGDGKFYVYNGSVNEIPCPVKEFVFDNINYQQGDKVFAGINSEYNEVTWFYPSASSSENDRYVTFNYSENVWTYGGLARTAWLDRGVNDFPLAASPDKYLYFHEVGLNDVTSVTAPINAYIESSPFDIAEGDQFAFVRRIIPDITFYNSTNSTGTGNSPRATMTVKVQNFPGSNYSSSTGSSVSQTATIPIEQFTEQAFIRLRGRQMTFRIESNQINTRWSLGSPRLDIQKDGRR